MVRDGGGAVSAPMPDDMREFLAAIRDALDVPLPWPTRENEAQYRRLLEQRAGDVAYVTERVMEGHPIDLALELLHDLVAHHPVTYALTRQQDDGGGADGGGRP